MTCASLKTSALSLCLAILPGTAWAQSAEVSVATGEWAPFTGEKLSGYGAAAELVTAAFKAGGLTVKYSFVPWKRAEASTADGQFFATFPYLKTPERVGTFDFSAPIFSSSIGLLRHTKNPKTANFHYSKPEDLKGFVVGTTAGTKAVTVPLEAAKVSCEETPLLDTSIRKLEMDRLDFVVDERTAAMETVKRLLPNAAGDFEFTAGDFSGRSQYVLLVSKKYPNAEELLKKLNAGLKKISEDGTAKAIAAKYGLTL